MSDVAGDLQSKFGPVSRSYFVAKRVVATQHRQGNLNENSISVYARTHKLEEVTIGLSLLCALPADVIERALFDKNRETLLILPRRWISAGRPPWRYCSSAPRTTASPPRNCSDLEREFGRLNIETSRSVLEFYQSRKNIDKNAASIDTASKRQAVRAAS